MPRLTGTAAKHFWIAYMSDQVLDGTPVEPVWYKVQVSLRHIHWLKSLGFTDAALIPSSPGIEYKNGSGTPDLKARTLALSNGTKRRTVTWPSPVSELWTLPLNHPTVQAISVALEGETGNWHITGRRGERESNAVPPYAGQ